MIGDETFMCDLFQSVGGDLDKKMLKCYVKLSIRLKVQRSLDEWKRESGVR